MDIEDILKRLGWEDGFQIPVANDENRGLEERLAKLSLRKNKAKNKLDRANSRLEGLKEHFKYITQENEQTQKLITAHKQQYEAVQNCYHLLRSERANVEHNMKKMARELEDLQRRQESKKMDLQKNMIKAERLKTETEWDAEALKAWEETLKKRDADIELIKKFSLEDSIKYNDLEARRQLLQMESNRKLKGLERLITDLRNNEMIIDRTGKVLKQQEIERDALVKQWKEAVKMLQHRDEDVIKAQEQIVCTQELIEKQKERLNEENGFLANEQRNNHELDLEMESLNALSSRMRRNYSDLTQELLIMNSELHGLKREVASSAQQLENERMKLKRQTETLEKKERMCIKFADDIIKLKQKLEEMKGSNINSAEKIRNIEKLIEAEDKMYNMYVSDTEKINGHMFRCDKVLKEQIAAGKQLEMDLNNAMLSCTQLRKHTRTQKKEIEKIKEVVYNMEFRIDEFESRLLKLECEHMAEGHSEEKEKEIDALEVTLVDHKAVQHTLQNQVDRLREEMNRLNTAIALDKEQMAILKEKCEQHLLENEISKKHIAMAKKSTQEKQVEENMMRLRLNQIEKDMRKEEKMIFTMEKLRLNLDQVMRERQIEINTNKMILQTKRRNLDEEKGRLRGEISIRRMKIDLFQKKYHIMLMSLGRDEDGRTFSMASFKIKYAQEKFMLQQRGDALDQKIKTAEREIVAMENTLKMVNLTNAAFKNSLAPVSDEDKEVQEMKILEEELLKLSNTLRQYKKDLAKKKDELQELQNQAKEKDTVKAKVRYDVTNLEDEYELIRKQETDKVEKLKRAECQVKRLLKKIGKKNISKYDRDFEIRVIKEGNKNVLQRLTEMCGFYPEMGPLINRYISEHNLSLPLKKTSWTSSSSSSSILISNSCSSNWQMSHSSRTTSSITLNEISTNKVDLSLNI
ncbi:hypothetical protein NQ315_016320 [Exocentrus adspersus]|uniref:Coiled-coil domain-containing protein 39 n=1 Tax=Exocentrus adspersus TaxID=1586481 RepID=A0AAV8VR19_9CUCU|nr:hypothetical protein NQ315_016320 [Exocentrus adspersus]